MKLREFIETEKDTINSRNFTGLYRKANYYIGDEARGQLTDLLYKIGIDPLKWMGDMPNYFLYGLKFDKFEIPDNIETIYTSAFANSVIGKLILPRSIKTFYVRSFDLSSIKVVTYFGSMKEFKNITNYRAIMHSGIDKILCVDGTVVL